MVLHHRCYSSEKEVNKRHSGRLINRDQSGRIEASCYLHSTSGPRSRVITLRGVRHDSESRRQLQESLWNLRILP